MNKMLDTSTAFATLKSGSKTEKQVILEQIKERQTQARNAFWRRIWRIEEVKKS